MGKLKKSSQLPQQHRRKLLDLLLIDRIDKVLKIIALDQNFQGFSKPLRESLGKSLRLAGTLLPKEQLEEFQSNMENVINMRKTEGRTD